MSNELDEKDFLEIEEELQRLRDGSAAFTAENVSAAVEQDRREFEELIHTNSCRAFEKRFAS